ncbi:YwqJ-related putative deaminase [Streptomyces xiamenensis]|uniref:YwqJ-related putative deaminase n=1 Tax=Streptomyces xiamenensis TaxID=408015 RepID=UPI0035D8C6E7
MRRTSLSSDGPRVASSLLIDGTVLSQTNMWGEGAPTLHPSVRSFLADLPQYDKEPFAGLCAESALISDQFWRLEENRGNNGEPPISFDGAQPHFLGAFITSRQIRTPDDPLHMQPIGPCSSCLALMRALGVEFIL